MYNIILLFCVRGCTVHLSISVATKMYYMNSIAHLNMEHGTVHICTGSLENNETVVLTQI